ncbi:MAG: N-acetylmuramoyl-L-alanine amidase [Proteobacteria bacterium]|nr:N-acetylmuramoyl-L-alanine amidase [Pseudomonadota bacterium]
MEKYILFAGRKIPVATTYNVVLFDSDKAQSFYHPENSLSPADLLQMQTIRPELKTFSFRSNKLTRTGDQLFNVPRAEIDILSNHITQIAFHHDVTFSASKTFDILCKRGISTHFDINYDGTIYQFLDCYHSAWATGDNNNMSVAIDMNNPVLPEMKESDPANGLRDIYQDKINGSLKTMLGYTDAQYESLIALLKAFITPIQIPGEPDWIPLPNISSNCFPPITDSGEIINRLLKNPTGFVGMLGHYHCSAQKWDPGPAFDWMRVLSGLKGERNSLPLYLDRDDHRNLSDVAGAALKNLLDKYYLNAEINDGGWYPIGTNQSWHSGIHLSATKGTSIMNMMKGKIVAVRNVKTVDLGDPSFVLVRHEREETGTDGKPKSIYWYSLYMHLAYIDTPDDFEKIPWIGKLLENDFEIPIDFHINYKQEDRSYEKRVPQHYNAIEDRSDKTAIKNAFLRGDIILTELDVAAGEKLGSIGLFGLQPGLDNLSNQVHIEVFSEENIFQTRNSQQNAWLITEGDDKGYSIIPIKRILRPIQDNVQQQTGRRPSFLKTSEIQSFFNGGAFTKEERESFRKMICYHQSEWSPLMNWTKTAVQSVGWQWENEKSFGQWLIYWLPFQWMTKKVLADLGIKSKNHLFFTYHPIYLLEQLNSSYAGDIRATAEEASDEEAAAQNKAYKKDLDTLMELNKKRKQGIQLTPEEIEIQNQLYEKMDDHLDDKNGSINAETAYDYSRNKVFDDYAPGEWPAPQMS